MKGDIRLTYTNGRIERDEHLPNMYLSWRYLPGKKQLALLHSNY